MTEVSFPKVELPLSDDEWKTVALPMGRGVIDRGGHPYRLTNLDSVSDTVTIEVATVEPFLNEALLDGFVHRIDTAKKLSIPPVSVETVYEIGLAYNPLNHSAAGGPIGLYAWTTPADNSGGISRLVLYRLTRSPNVSLANSPWTEERPRVAPVITVSRESQRPVSGLVLVDTICVVRTTGQMYRAEIAADGTITWPKIGATDLLASGSSEPVAGKAVLYGGDGGFLVINPTHASHPTTKSYVDARASWGGLPGKPSTFTPSAHTHFGDDIKSRIPFEHVDGSTSAYSNTNLGSTWTSVAVNSAGFLGRYPSALKYKKNIRAWNPDPKTILEMEPVQYDVRPDTAGASEDSDQGLIGFVADSYVETRRELVLVQDGEVEGFHYHLMPVAQQVVLRWLAQRVRDLEVERDTLKFNQGEILAYLGLSTDAGGRVITNGSGV